MNLFLFLFPSIPPEVTNKQWEVKEFNQDPGVNQVLNNAQLGSLL
jgi:hypothetical protein